jgi:hypothetical protein
MHTEKEHIDPDVLATMGYERRDVNVAGLRRAVFIFYAFALGSAIFAAVVLYWGVTIPFLNVKVADPYMERTTVQQKNDFANRESRILPQYPNPLVQNNVTAKVELHEMRQAEDDRLNGTGYLDESRSRVFIPIERAKQILLQRGLPKTGSEGAVSRGNDVGPFDQTPAVRPPDRSGPTGDPSISAPQTPAGQETRGQAPAGSAPNPRTPQPSIGRQEVPE